MYPEKLQGPQVVCQVVTKAPLVSKGGISEELAGPLCWLELCLRYPSDRGGAHGSSSRELWLISISIEQPARTVISCSKMAACFSRPFIYVLSLVDAVFKSFTVGLLAL